MLDLIFMIIKAFEASTWKNINSLHKISFEYKICKIDTKSQ